jgi:hypothetical protein
MDENKHAATASAAMVALFKAFSNVRGLYLFPQSILTEDPLAPAAKCLGDEIRLY